MSSSVSDAQEADQKQSNLDLINILNSTDGRRFLWGLMDELCGVHGPSFSGESTHGSAFREGRRAVGIDLMEMCQRADATSYVRMVEEALARRQLKADAESDDGGDDRGAED